MRETPRDGRCLSEQLFGKLDADAWHKPNWLIAGDGVLLNGVPFSALPQLPFSGSQAPLTGSHTLRFLPSELLLLKSQGTTFQRTQRERRFLGVADPIYNLADSRRMAKPDTFSGEPYQKFPRAGKAGRECWGDSDRRKA
jgi:hypothetical protein